MLQLLLGRSGFGKTRRILDELRQLTKSATADEVFYLLVPEQASFETERALIRSLGEADAAKVRVISFTRLYETVIKDHTARPLSNGAKIMLMSRAMEEASDSLELLTASSRVDTVTALLDTADECRRCAVAPSQLASVVDALPVGTLKTKTGELSLLLETYDALSASCGRDAQESLLLLSERLTQTRVLAGAHVYVDGFNGFTAPEQRVLTAIMAQAERLTVALCADRDAADPDSLDRLAISMGTAARLKRLATDCGCPIAKPIFLMTPYRFQNEALCVLEEGAFCPKDPEKEISFDQENVTLTACADIYAEARFVAQSIRRMMRKDGVRARDIAVVARNLSDYIGVMDAAFEQAGIPYYLDRRAPIVCEGLVTAVLTALRIAAGNWRADSLLQLVKTGLLGFSVSSASLLENYVYIWNISGAQFKTEWQAHPRGFASALEERDQSRLEHLNRLRRRLVRPLMALADDLTRPLTGEEFAKAVYRYIRKAQLDRMTRRQILHLRRNGEPVLAEHTAQVWEALIGLLDDMTRVLPDRIDVKDAIELLHAAAMGTDIGSIPQALDAVQFGAADRMRFTEPKAVFIVGANEGVFPALPGGQGLLTDRERLRLIEAGVPFEDDRERHTAMELYLAYAALSAASEYVHVSYLLKTPDGEKGEISSIGNTLKVHLGLEERPSFEDDGNDIETTDEAFERMASGFRAGTPLSRALFDLLWKDEALRGRLAKMKHMANEMPITFENEEAAKRFFGDRMILSPSRVQQYHQCRFSYFCKYGVKAQPLRAAEIGTPEFGVLTHYVMENTLPVYIDEDIRTITKARCFADAEESVNRYVENEMGGMADKPERFLYRLTRLRRVCGNFLWQAVRELSQSQFVPVDYELDIALQSDDENAVKPLIFTLPDGTAVSMTGKIDRVDSCEIKGKRYLRVIDYKTGSKVFRLEDVVEGINLQTLIYMMTLWKNGKARYGEVLPAGMLYMPSTPPMITSEGPIDPKDMEAKQTRAMRMNGLLLDDEQVLRAMERDIKGVFIPVIQNVDGRMRAGSPIASLEQLGALGRRAEKLLAEMAQTLRDGNIDAAPFVQKDNTKDPCEYCPYKAVCGHEIGDRVRTPQYANQNILDTLLEEYPQEEST